MRKRDATLIFLGGLVLSVVLIGAGYWFVFDQPHRQAAALTDVTETQRAEIESSNRRINAEIVAGILLALTVGATLWRVKVADKTAEATRQSAEAARLTAEAAQQTAQASLQSQINERFTTAIELLTSKELPSRLGGIYSLERIAKESEEHHWPVIETLAAFIRANAPRDFTDNDSTALGDASTRTAVEAALTVIGRRNHEFDAKDRRVNLQGCDFRGMNLAGLHLATATLMNTHLGLTGFVDTNLEGAVLRGIFADGAQFLGAKLRGATFEFAELRATNFKNADLRDADFMGATTTGASIDGADLRDTKYLSEDQVRAMRWLPLDPPTLPPAMQHLLVADEHEDVQ